MQNFQLVSKQKWWICEQHTHLNTIELYVNMIFTSQVFSMPLSYKRSGPCLCLIRDHEKWIKEH